MSILQPKVGKLTSSGKAIISAKYFEAGLKPNSCKNHGNNDLVSLNCGRELTSFEDCAKPFWLTFAETVWVVVINTGMFLRSSKLCGKRRT